MMIVPNQRIKPTLKFIADGDTLKLNYEGQDFHSRARWIDAPEMQKPGQYSDNPQILKHWEWAIKSKEFLGSLITRKPLIIIPYELDQYNRWLCDWYVGTVSASTNIQLQMCLAGMCAYYLPFQYYSFPTTRELSLYTGIIKNCAKAYKLKSGFWKEDKFMLPHEIKSLKL
ncbi:thermonuclease family protein [Dolichospermum sp. LEGE 00246]|jgi:endonuclease YncB( thermonuclease family)|uniref:thermonuclease family protein n=1 Tax=Dolichospermum sp. LEGE 00246 TaxID=1828605 RepID=UPI001D136338|nr:thermonuclease family protein [Dolichospermum sp. LEGE 00246]MDK2409896.1 thermonuclease family protein [Aphanizomenon sp. 202]MDK2460861.1 thermonuclease family protein [Aphanizomenon sp. PH219]